MESWDTYSLIALLIIFCALFSFFSRWTKILYLHVLSPILVKPKDLVKLYGPWAVVTGGSNGIGKNLAKELARRGANIVLISNEKEKLSTVAEEIKTECGVETKVIFADFSHADEEYTHIFDAIKDLDVGILVNNVGTAGGLPGLFENMTRKQMWDLTMINVCAATSMTHFVLPKMKSKRCGLIVNIASTAGMFPTPFATLYGASKAFMMSFSDALRYECKGTGVEIQTIHPGFVDTNIIDSNAKSTPSIFFPTPEKFAKNLCSNIGVVSSTAGYMAHDIQCVFGEMLPRCVQIWLGAKYFEVKNFHANEQKEE
ncbi:hydroxysteroid dehydrogenase-like protein 1 [Cloeon dipterum]|uniref:hydroxysteroid dehydrogenase-like protein 1 n=1 Tax=Cloeon dipterum TaxID=197152 RepID=UPI0032208BCE